MSFKIIVGDITKFEADVIINSVGVTSSKHGGICGAILKVADSKQLNKIIDGVDGVYTVGEYFITKGYNLPAENILHLITPHHDDDKDCSQYKECIRRVLNECQYRHWHNVGIPLLGAGANKYEKEAKEIISEMCEAYWNHYPRMNITLVTPHEEISEKNDARISREAYNYSKGEYHDPETVAKFKKGSKKLFKTIDNYNPSSYTKKYFAYDSFAIGRDEVSIKTKGIKTIGEYVDAFATKIEDVDPLFPDAPTIKQRINIFFGYGKKGKDTFTHAGSDAYGEIRNNSYADKKVFYKIMFALRMMYSEATSFLSHFGYCFAPHGVNEMDDAVTELIHQRKYGIVEIELKMPTLFKK